MGVWLEVLGKLVLASILGGLIGWERETQGKAAGLRTQMLVALAAALFVLGARQAAQAAGEVVDAGRAMAGVAQGVGFLGAGLILRTRGEILGLTTAAALWTSAALGMTAAQGLYPLAVIGGILAFAILHWVAVVEERWADKRKEQTVRKGDDSR
jgi:putative Mg2+ transporter-C (MgtC) family protein